MRGVGIMGLSGSRWAGSAFVVMALLLSSPSIAQEGAAPAGQQGAATGIEDHFTVQMSVDPAGSVDSEGVVTLRGTFACDWVREDRLTTMVALNVNLRQANGAARGAGSLIPPLTDDCADYASWEATFRSEGEPFRPGAASVETWAWMEYTWPGPCEDDPGAVPPSACGWGSTVEQNHEVTLSAVGEAPPAVEAAPQAESSSATDAPAGEADAEVAVRRPTRVDTGGGGTAPPPPG
jgi:hypothetical protein